jgi:hypothetical protein
MILMELWKKKNACVVNTVISPQPAPGFWMRVTSLQVKANQRIVAELLVQIGSCKQALPRKMTLVWKILVRVTYIVILYFADISGYKHTLTMTFKFHVKKTMFLQPH